MSLNPAALGITTIVGTLKHFIEVADSAQGQMERLASQLSSTGQEVDKNIAKFDDLAAKISQVTMASKDDVKALISHGMELGLNADQSAQFAVSAQGLAKATGMDTKTALEGLVKSAHGMKSVFDKAVPSIAACATQEEKLAEESRLTKVGLEQMFDENKTGDGQMAKLQKTIDGLCKVLGEALLPIFDATVGALAEWYGWVAQLIATCTDFGFRGVESFGTVGTSVSSLGTKMQSAFTTIKEWIKTVVFTFMNLDLTVENIGITIAELFDGAVAYVSTFVENVGIAITWVWDNWQSIFTTLASFTQSVFQGLTDNIMALWTAMKNWFATGEWDFGFKDMLPDFKNAIKELPKFKSTELLDYSGLKEENAKKIDARMQEFENKWKANTPPPDEQVQDDLRTLIGKGLPKLGDIQGDKAKKDKSTAGEFTGIAEVWKKMQTSILKGDTEKQALKHQEATAKNTLSMWGLFNKLLTDGIKLAGLKT